MLLCAWIGITCAACSRSHGDQDAGDDAGEVLRGVDSGLEPEPDAGRDDECPPRPPLPDDSRMRGAVNAVRSFMDENSIPGAALVIVHGDDTFIATMGEVKQDGCPVTHDTRFALGLVSRVVTNMAVLAEVRAQGIDVHSPVTKYLDEIPVTANSQHPDFGDANEVTIHDLLSWSGGIPQESDVHRRVACSESLAEWAEGPQTRDGEPFELMFRPGALTTFSLSDSILLGRLLERISRHDYAAAVRERVFEPLGMDTAAINVPDLAEAPVARPHLWKGGGRQHVPLSLFGCAATAPGWLVWTSANDAAALLKMLLRRDPMIFDDLDFDRLEAVEGKTDPRYASRRMGYAFMSEEREDRPLGKKVGWVGGGPGYIAGLKYYPEESFGVFEAYNLISVDKHVATTRRPVREIMDQFFPDREPRPCYCRENWEECGTNKAVNCTNPDKLQRDRGDWASRYVGTYVSTVGPIERIEVTFEDGELLIEHENDGTSLTALPIGLDAFTVANGELERETLAFTADDGGNPRWLTVGNGTHRVWVAE